MPPMNEQECLKKMVPPSKRRSNAFRGGIIQIQITRACTQSCFGCTQASNLAGKPAMMTPSQFEVACQSLEGYWGVVGLFGGDPCLSPYFEEICGIFCKYFPKEQRGLWANDPCGKGEICRRTFNPKFSNINVHLDRKAYDEFCRDWPEVRPYIFGLEEDSRHGPPFVAMKDLGLSQEEIYEKAAACDVNQSWSALCGIYRGNLRAYVCEVMYSQAVIHENDQSWPDLGMEAVPGWWKRPMQDFADQVNFHCGMCGIPLRGYGELAIGGTKEQVSQSHAGWFRPKIPARPVQIVTSLEEMRADSLMSSTQYIQNADLPVLQ